MVETNLCNGALDSGIYSTKTPLLNKLKKKEVLNQLLILLLQRFDSE